MKAIIAGGSGYLGKRLARHFVAQGMDVVVLGRSGSSPKNTEGIRYVQWDGKTLTEWWTELEGADLLINLAGRTVNCRYTEENRKQMFDSRVESTRVLGDAVKMCSKPPKVWLNSSTATIYSDMRERDQTESTGVIGKGFSVHIAQSWEEVFFAAAATGVRQVALRSAMVFGDGKDGVYEAFRGITRLGLGGAIGDGGQYISWIHIDDFIGMIEWIIKREELSGTINLASPDPRTNRDFMHALRKALGIWIGLPASEWMVEIGAFFMKTETELLLKSRRVVPERILASGYRMKHPTLESALEQLTVRR